MKLRTFALALSLVLLPALVGAQAWQATSPSTLGFEGRAQGERFVGEFKRFSARVDFDPAALGSTRFDVEIELGSADSQNAERDELLREAAFFDLARQPRARFVASAAEPAEGGYLSRGTLSLNGRSQPVELRFYFQRTGDGAQLEGEAVLDRTDFAVGSGDWEDPEVIEHPVKVSTRLTLIAVSDGG